MLLPRRALPALTGGLLLPRRLRADAALPGAELLLVAMSDLHSAMERAPAALGALDATLAANRGVEAVILVNGDVFERGNAVALRCNGAPDWAFLAALRKRAPVVLNIGNHETALIDDLREVVARARALDLVVLSNLRDRRTGQDVTAADLVLPLRGGRRLALVGIGTDEAATYRPEVRDLLELPAPAAWAREHLPRLLDGADATVVLSHAGIAADRAILPLLPDGSLLIGGHEHLRFVHAQGATRYVHAGSWNRCLAVAGLAFGGAAPRITLHEVAIEPGQAEDAAHAALLREVMAAHATPEDREVLFHLPRPLPLGEAARRAAAAVAAATQAGTGLLGHTGFGTGLPGGEVTRLAFDAFLRFDGTLFRAEVDQAALDAMRPRLNQDEPMPFGQRIGDFSYAAPWPGAPGPAAPGPLACNGWVRSQAGRYLGTAALRFEEVPELRLKPLVAAALRNN